MSKWAQPPVSKNCKTKSTWIYSRIRKVEFNNKLNCLKKMKITFYSKSCHYYSICMFISFSPYLITNCSHAHHSSITYMWKKKIKSSALYQGRICCKYHIKKKKHFLCVGASYYHVVWMYVICDDACQSVTEMLLPNTTTA